MPRRRKTQSGADAQRIESVAGQRYGEGVAQQQMQRAMPAPQVRDTNVSQPVTSPAQPTVAQQMAAAPPPRNPAELLAQAPRGILRQPTQGRPITAGLPSGPGPGPEVASRYLAKSPMRRTLEQLYQRTNNPAIQRILNEGRL